MQQHQQQQQQKPTQPDHSGNKFDEFGSRSRKEARETKRQHSLVTAHFDLVDRIAEQVHAKMTHLEIDDLKQAGCLGLMEAARRYRPESGAFAHYAYFRVRGAMLDAHKRVAYRNETMSSLDSMDGWGEDDEVYFNGIVPGSLTEDPDMLPEALAARRERAKLLARALRQLNPDEQKVFMASLQGLSLRATARKFRRPVHWAREKLARARRHLGARVHMWGMGLDEAA